MGEKKSVSVGTLTKGSYIIVDDAACRISTMQTSRPGKHGHAKINLMAVGIIDGKKRNLVIPGHDHVDVPIVEKKIAQVLSISGHTANVMNSETYETFDLEIPDDLKGQVIDGVNVLYWEILDSKVMKQVKGTE